MAGSKPRDWVFPSPRRILRLLRHPRARLWEKSLVIGTLAYVIWPLDAIPDLAPWVGWLDDLGVTSVALLFLSRALAKYEEKPQTPS